MAAFIFKKVWFRGLIWWFLICFAKKTGHFVAKANSCLIFATQIKNYPLLGILCLYEYEVIRIQI